MVLSPKTVTWFDHYPLRKLICRYSTLCSDKKWSKILSSNLTIVSLQWSVCFYFLSTSDCRSLCLVYVFTIILSRNLPIFVYHAFLFSKTFLTQPLIYYITVVYWFLSFLCLVPSLCLYIKYPLYIGIEKELSNEYLFWFIASPHFKTKLKYPPYNKIN